MKSSRLLMDWITQRLLLPLTLALAIVAPGLLYPASAGAAETLDQSQPVSMSPATVSSSTQQAQIFTAGRYGWLDQVSLYLENYTASPPAGAVLSVSVQTIIQGLPSGIQISSGTIPLSAIPAPGHVGWVDVNLRRALVAAGTQYALVLQTSHVFGSVTWWYAYTGYAGGTTAFNDGTAWTVDEPYDFTFKTYVIPDVMDQSQTRETYVHTGSTMGQIFTAGLSGVLDRVRVDVGRFGWPLEVTIQTVTEEGYPSGTVIGQGFIPEVNWDHYYGSWYTVAISGAGVTAGTQYALVLHAQDNRNLAEFDWWYGDPDATGSPRYPGGNMVVKDDQGWKVVTWGARPLYAKFETYVAPLFVLALPPPPATITPCSSGVCPAVSGFVNPPASPAGVTSNVRFWERPDGKIDGILHFDDSRTGGFVLKGCGTNSAACRLTVTTFACTDERAIRVAGAYRPKGETAGSYRLTLSGVRDGIGIFTLTAGHYTYTLMHNGIVDVTCPPAAGVAEGNAD